MRTQVPGRGLRLGVVVVARAWFAPATFHFSGERCNQLSYLAKTKDKSDDISERDGTALATPTGLEPATSAVTGRRANQLRYGAITGLRAAFLSAFVLTPSFPVPAEL